MTKCIATSTLLAVFLLLSCSDGRKTAYIESIESTVQDMQAIGERDFDQRIERRLYIMLVYDSLLALYPNDKDMQSWRSAKEVFAAANTRDRDFKSYFRLMWSIDSIETGDTDARGEELDSASVADTLKVFSDYLDIIRHVEAESKRIIETYADDPLIDSVKEQQLAVATKRKLVEYFAFNLIAAALKGYQMLGVAGCEVISLAWGNAIKADVAFSSYVQEISESLRDRTASEFEYIETTISESLVLFEPTHSRSRQAYDCLETAFIKAKMIVGLCFAPEGSLVSYNAKVRQLSGEVDEQLARFELAASRLTKLN